MPLPPVPRPVLHKTSSLLSIEDIQAAMVEVDNNFRALIIYLERLRASFTDSTQEALGVDEAAPSSPSYLVVSLSDLLENERSLTVESGVLSYSDGGAGFPLTLGIASLGVGTTKLATGAVTFVKMQSINLARLLGSDISGTVEEIAVTGGLEFSGAGFIHTSAFTGDVTKPLGSVVQTIPNDTVTYAKMQNVSAASRLLGRGSAAGAGDTQELTVGSGLSIASTVLNTTVPTESGTYSPTLTNVANLDSSTAYTFQYQRVGSVVTVSGKVDCDPTLAATLTTLGITLPIASALAATEQCAGTASSAALALTGAILADTTNDRAELRFLSVGTTSLTLYLHFTYLIV